MATVEEKYAILTDAAEDCTGLWDIVWELRDTEDKHDANVMEATQVVLELMSHELVELHIGSTAAGSAATNEIRLKGTDEINRALSNPEYWHPPGLGRDYVCLSTTKVGYALWLKGKSVLAELLA